MKNIQLLLMIVFGLLLGACSKEDMTNELCISFDIRQCDADPWAVNRVDANKDENVLNSIKSYLESQQVQVAQIGIDVGFHQIVCEACTVCPSGPRIYVRSDEAGAAVIQSLGLLNYETVSCAAIFQ